MLRSPTLNVIFYFLGRQPHLDSIAEKCSSKPFEKGVNKTAVFLYLLRENNFPKNLVQGGPVLPLIFSIYYEEIFLEIFIRIP